MKGFTDWHPTTPLHAVAMCLALSVADAAAQSYPKLMTNGHGLALTRFAVAEKNGSGWTTATTYKHNGEYRITLRLTNFYPPINLGGYDRCHVHKIIDLEFQVSAAGSFYSNSSFSGAGTSVYYHQDPAPLGNGQSRSYHVYLKWMGPPGLPTSAYDHKFRFSGGEVCLLLPMSLHEGRVRQTQ